MGVVGAPALSAFAEKRYQRWCLSTVQNTSNFAL
jgi:hypothetical protein